MFFFFCHSYGAATGTDVAKSRKQSDVVSDERDSRREIENVTIMSHLRTSGVQKLKVCVWGDSCMRRNTFAQTPIEEDRE